MPKHKTFENPAEECPVCAGAEGAIFRSDLDPDDADNAWVEVEIKSVVTCPDCESEFMNMQIVGIDESGGHSTDNFRIDNSIE